MGAPPTAVGRVNSPRGFANGLVPRKNPTVGIFHYGAGPDWGTVRKKYPQVRYASHVY